MATTLFPRQRALFRSWRNKKHQRPAGTRSRMLREERLEQRTVLSAASLVESLDFDGDEQVGLGDLDMINCWVGSGSKSMPYYEAMDLNHNGELDRGDVDEMVAILETTYGDADYNRRFDTSDLKVLFEANEFEDGIRHNSTWATGDFDGNREFDTADLIYALQNSVFEPDADVDNDGLITAADIDLVNCWVGASGTKHGPYADEIDINRDGTLDREDVNEVVRLAGSTYGDANMDGIFSTSDLVEIMKAGKMGGRGTWVEGDFNGDQHVSTDDLVFAFENSVFGLDDAAIDVVFAT